MEKYNNKTIRNSCIDYMRMNSETQKIENYIDMTVKEDKCLEVKVETDLRVNYSVVKNVRSTFDNTPVPNEPMELFSIIQL